ncbi:hypothetical protein [Micromonospora eburnea]|nr:hypothetical protein [Micromonospora eburnea]
MGFRDTITGLHDLRLGLKGVDEEGKSLGLEEQLLMIGFGVGDLASGFYNLLIPQLKSAVGWFAQTRVGALAVAAAQKAWAGAQALLNLSLWTSPITWIVVGVIALIAVIVLIATKTDWFQKAWRASWGWIKSAASSTWDFIKKIPGWIGSAFSRIGDAISRPFKAGFNAVATGWNRTVGRLSWTVPSWVPVIGGNSISVPHLPTFHAGGRVPGAPGQNVLAMLQAGETVNSAAGSAGATLTIDTAGSRLDDLLVEILARAIKKRGGYVQYVLGGRA